MNPVSRLAPTPLAPLLPTPTQVAGFQNLVLGQILVDNFLQSFFLLMVLENLMVDNFLQSFVLLIVWELLVGAMHRCIF